MINVNYKGFLGNNMFQYSMGRIIAENLGYQLNANPIIGFPKTSHQISGKLFNHPVQVIRGNVFDLSRVIADKNDRLIYLDGFFQRYEYYPKYKSQIKEWFSIDNRITNDYDLDEESIVLHIRLDDYKNVNGGYSVLPYQYYKNCISKSNCKKVFICTDEPSSELLDEFKKEFGATICNQYRIPLDNCFPEINERFKNNIASTLRDYKVLNSAKKIVLSQSTFSWWAAWLSDAKEVYFPLSKVGFWNGQMDIDLKVNDETRYIYMEA
jgi:hypothetical protein